MSAEFTDEAAEAIKAWLRTATRVPVVDFDEAAALQTDHVILDLSERYVAERRMSGYVSSRGGRLMTRCICKSISNVRTIRTRVDDAIRGALIPFDGDYLGAFAFETEGDVAQDEGWYVLDLTYTF